MHLLPPRCCPDGFQPGSRLFRTGSGRQEFPQRSRPELVFMAHLPPGDGDGKGCGGGGREEWGLCFVTLMKHRFLPALFASFGGDIRTPLSSGIPPLLSWRSCYCSPPRVCPSKRQSPVQHQRTFCVEQNSCNGTELWVGALPRSCCKNTTFPRSLSKGPNKSSVQRYLAVLCGFVVRMAGHTYP